jgi:hypothetical protein
MAEKGERPFASSENRRSILMKSQPRSWFRLLAFCSLAAAAVALVFATLLASATVAFAFGRSFNAPANTSGVAKAVESSTAPERTFSGVVTDSFCGARHARHFNLSPADCTRFCVHNGAKYVLVDGEKKYALEGDAAQLSKLAGQRITFKGALEGDAVSFSALSPAN